MPDEIITPTPNDPVRKSECHLADVTEKYTVYEETKDGTVAGVEFICSECDQPCAAYADPRLIAIAQEAQSGG